MATSVQVEVDKAALAALTRTPQARAVLQRAGDAVATRAAQLAPKHTSAGAQSIHAELSKDQQGPYAAVSWDRDHFYLLFHEIGTSRDPARPFLRPALASTRI